MAVAPKLYSVAETAEILSCSPDHVYDLIARGDFAVVDIGSGRRPKTRISAAVINGFIKSHTRTA